MLGYIRGEAIKAEEGELIISGSGVGYRVKYTGSDINAGDSVELYLHTAVRENEISLWGFKNWSDLKMFEQLISVSGIGVRTAYTMLSVLGAQTIASAVQHNAPERIKAPGVGKKTAERMVVELRDKLKWKGDSDSANAGVSESLRHFEDDVTAALEQLGYRPAEIRAALKRVDPKDHTTDESLLKALLAAI